MLPVAAAPALADPCDGAYRGRIEGRDHRLLMQHDGFGRYQGILAIDDVKLALEAARFGERLAGRLSGEGGHARLVIELQGSLLLLSWPQEGRTLRLRREAD